MKKNHLKRKHFVSLINKVHEEDKIVYETVRPLLAKEQN